MLLELAACGSNASSGTTLAADEPNFTAKTRTNGTVTVVDVAATNMVQSDAIDYNRVVITVNYDMSCFSSSVARVGNLLDGFLVQTDTSTPGVMIYTATSDHSPANNSGSLMSVSLAGIKDCSDKLESVIGININSETHKAGVSMISNQSIPVTAR